MKKSLKFLFFLSIVLVIFLMVVSLICSINETNMIKNNASIDAILAVNARNIAIHFYSCLASFVLVWVAGISFYFYEKASGKDA